MSMWRDTRSLAQGYSRLPLSKGPSTGFTENFEAMWNQIGHAERSFFMDANRREATDNLIEEYERRSGQDFDRTGSEYLASKRGRSIAPGNTDIDHLETDMGFLKQWAEENPGQALGMDFDVDSQAATMAREAEEEFEDVSSRASTLGYAGMFAGGFTGVMQDPIIAASTVVGGMGLSTAAMSFLRGLTLEAGFVGLTEAPTQLMIQQEREEIGLPAGIGRAATNTAFAVGGASAFYGIARGASAALRSLRASGRGDPADEMALQHEIFRGEQYTDPPINNPDRTDLQFAQAEVDNLMGAVARNEPIEDLPRFRAYDMDDDLMEGSSLRTLRDSADDIDLDRPGFSARARQIREAFEEIGAEELRIGRQQELDEALRQAGPTGRGLLEDLQDVETTRLRLQQEAENTRAAANSVRNSDVPRDLRPLEKYVDEGSFLRLQEIRSELDTPDLSLQRFQALNREASGILDTLDDEVGLTARLEQDADALSGKIEDGLSEEQARREAYRTARRQVEGRRTQARDAVRRQWEQVGKPLTETNGRLSRSTPDGRVSTARREQITAAQRAAEDTRARAEPSHEEAVTDSELAQVRAALEANPELTVRVQTGVDEFSDRPVREVLDEIEQDEAFLREFEVCRRGQSV